MTAVTTNKPVITLDQETGIVSATHNGVLLAEVHKDALQTEDFRIGDGDNESLYEFVKRFTSVDAVVEAIKLAAAAVVKG